MENAAKLARCTTRFNPDGVDGTQIGVRQTGTPPIVSRPPPQAL